MDMWGETAPPANSQVLGSLCTPWAACGASARGRGAPRHQDSSRRRVATPPRAKAWPRAAAAALATCRGARQ